MTCNCSSSSSTTQQKLCGGVQQSTTSHGCQPSGQPRSCPPSLLSAQAEQELRALVRPVTTSDTPGAIAVGASASFYSESNFVGTTRLIVFDDLVSSLVLDNFEVFVAVNGITRLDFFGGRFSRTNMGASGCGLAVCIGPIETMAITVKNIGSAAFGATDTITMQWHTVYEGEPGFAEGCGCGPNTSTAGTHAFQVSEVKV